jgi:hypothetical protein
MKRYQCRCGWSMPESCANAIAAHQKEHPTEQQIDYERNRRALETAVDAMDNRRPLGLIERMQAVNAILSAPPEMIFDEMIRKPLLKSHSAK